MLKGGDMTESSFQGQAGTIYTRSWEIDGARGEVVLVHGYGEHLGRYEHVATALSVRCAEDPESGALDPHFSLG